MVGPTAEGAAHPGVTLGDGGRVTGARKAEIVQATVRLVGEHGVAGVSLKRIAGAVGISDAALYRHFNSREEILIAAHAKLRKRVVAWLSSAQAPSAIDRLREIGEAHARHLSMDIQYFNAPMFQFSSWIAPDPVHEQVVKGRVGVRQWFTNLVEEGKEQGCIDRDIPTSLIVAEILARIWWEDLSYLQDLETEVATKTSAAMFAGILDRISPRKD